VDEAVARTVEERLARLRELYGQRGPASVPGLKDTLINDLFREDGPKGMISGTLAQVLDCVRSNIEREIRDREAFVDIEIGYHPWDPRQRVQVVFEDHTITMVILRGVDRFCAYGDDQFNDEAHQGADGSAGLWVENMRALHEPPRVPRDRPSRERAAITRETCRGCGGTYTEDNMFDCPHCMLEYCWRCKEEHVSVCSQESRS
jgi:hypothetical protein